MNNEIKNLLTKVLQNPKLKTTFLIIAFISQPLLHVSFPILHKIGFSNPGILKLSAHILTLLILWAMLVFIEWAIDKSSDIKCPYCGSYKFFVEESKTTGENIKNGSGLIKRLYKCKNCGKSEKIFVKPISINLASDDN